MTVTPLHRNAVADKNADPLRMALANAINEARKAEAAVVSQRAAIERAQAHLAKAELDLQTATAAVADAKNLDAADVAAAIHTAAAVGAPTAARKARAAEQEAADAVDVAKAALAKLETDLVNMEEASHWATNGAVAAVNAVLAPIASRLISEARDLKAKLHVNLAVAQLILGANDASKLPFIAEARAKQERDAPFVSLRQEIERLGALGGIAIAGDALPAALAAWREAIAALKADAATALPLPPP
jgi:hypothetical protein